MGIQVAIRHHTTYNYDRLVKLSPQVIRLRPAPHARSPIRGYSLNISPKNHFINWQQDPFGNYQARVVFPDRTKEFVIDVEVLIDMVTINPFDFFLEEYAEKSPFIYEDYLKKELGPYLEIKENGPLLQAWVFRAKAMQSGRTVDFLVQLNQELCEAVNYTIRLKPGVQTCEETLEQQLGSCRDSAWLLVQLLRHLGLAARFVSGYLVQLKADEKVIDGPSGTEQDFTDLHAWAEVYLPGAGWVGLDVTSGLFAGEGHIPLACTPDPFSAAPVSGLTEPCEVTFSYKNEVDRVWEKPRVTKPYSSEQWSSILLLGNKVEQSLTAGDVRLTMGGEPTFVSAEDMESDQWNESADGKEKRGLAYQLAKNLHLKFAPNGFIHMGEGKWYPGEPLPRWQYAVYWQKDGQTIWNDSKLLANPNQDYGFDESHAEQLIKGLAKKLRVTENNVLPAYEDMFYFLWEEGNLPVDVDPLKIDPKDKLARKTLAELLDRGLDRPKGYVLPLGLDPVNHTWESNPWEFSRKHLFLIPGNSAMGMRLPLDRLRKNSDKNKVELISTAICVEPREGKLYVFIPPVDTWDGYLDLLSQIEKTASELETPLIIEGYQPPHDIRLEKLAVTPDPGVIEVNIHPAQNWSELVSNYDTLFVMAKSIKLGTEKFMLDGKHSGTGGGNHITLGGSTLEDSPFLRRPDLLRSFVNFWQNHPGLSYLFSSAFIGPTSQAPRADEGRPEMLYELEIAFRELDRHPKPAPWLVDRLFRNLLIDVTGNTHRAEFCIDKLYNPDSSSGRLGILEMRGFDMPPHKEMCLSQLLLIRALTAAFWKNPYRQKLIRWGTELHDRFLIHHFVKEDLQDVVNYLQEEGFDYKLEWLAPFFEFRFPILGQISVGSIQLMIRAGIEPWNVLGEEISSAGTARFVDSSVERVEVMISGIQTERYALLCNQTHVPLTYTGTKGKYVAAIRYKAWNPPSALHPTIEVDVPLVFDIYDTWNKRSIGGCTYHVSHPGGRSYDTFPVNSYEAESRRVNRFWEHNHTPKTIEKIVNQETSTTNPTRYVSTTYEPVSTFPVKPMESDPEFPYTLDLRKVGKS